MKSPILVSPFFVIVSELGGCAIATSKRKCCKKYKKEGKTNCKRCPKL